MKETNIGVIGLGITGNSVINDLIKRGKIVYGFDENISFQEIVKVYPSIQWIDDSTINKLEIVIKSPGVPPDSKIIKILKENSIPIISDIEAAYRYFKTENIIAVTGTNGKTTTVLAIDYLLNTLTRANIFTAGNIGKGVFDLVDVVNAEDIVLLECSSFQLHDVEEFHPKVSVITNITSDHLDWHKTVENYQNSKKNIFKNMIGEDVLIINSDDPFSQEMELSGCIIEKVSIEKTIDRGIEIINGRFIRKKENEELKLGKVNELKIIGDHNMLNLAAAILAVEPFGVNPVDAFQELKKFSSVEHRLEFVREYHGINFYNDSKGTNPDSTDVALSSVNKPVILIAGGYDKCTSFTPLFERHKDKIKALILIGETAKQMEREGKEQGLQNIYIVDTLEETIKRSLAIGLPGDTVLLSPANASWDMFENYEIRGNVFKRIVSALEE